MTSLHVHVREQQRVMAMYVCIGSSVSILNGHY